MAVSLTTQDIAFLAVAERIQLSFLSETVNHSGEISRILAKIVKALPHTPFQAVGFNFVWALPAKDKSQFTEINRRFFLSKENPIAHDFASEDCRFGSYFSKDIPMGRLRLEIRPISQTGTEGLQLAFNFNRELQEGDSGERISEFLGKWADASGIANGMRNAIGGGWTQS
ncbi:hypothetical protein AYO43_09740 [Nitrospira sp. SCGC AG-212-E16]|nr:hypothetical protein AYO43_09740 [Nitrospira sp. SCGC AG-212-E16]